MRRLLCFAVVVGTFYCTNAQESKLKLTSSRNSDKSVDINYEKEERGTTTVSLKFKDLSNASLNRITYSVKDFSGTLLTLKPLNKDQPINYSYTFRYLRGELSPKIDLDFVYSLPYPTSTNVEVREARFLRATYFGSTQPEDWKVFYMITENPTEVIAARKGLVVEVVNYNDDVNTDEISYSSKMNKIVVEHADGTLLYYSGFEKGSIKVKVGDVIIPGQVIGVNTKKDNDTYAISFAVSYLKSIDQLFSANKNVTNAESYYGWVNPLFLTNGGISHLEGKKQYVSKVTDELIQKELTKKELKKWAK